MSHFTLTLAPGRGDDGLLLLLLPCSRRRRRSFCRRLLAPAVERKAATSEQQCAVAPAPVLLSPDVRGGAIRSLAR